MSNVSQKIVKILPNFIFMSRWLQAPLYLGLIIVLGVYVYEFGRGLFHLVGNADTLTETSVMLQALDLIDVVMIANLLIMVIIGGYETFVSRLRLQSHPDQPEWLDEVNAGTMKIKLALALVSISSIHLLRTFIDPGQKENIVVMWQVVIHITLVLSALAIAFSNKLITYFHTKEVR
jgi:uncharacterized protein (TIGR00645 family)